ncbi:unnamed protein product [Soboliphyme baturini]|uniref:F-box domain-containing protein n=1 Tax=Soboliphyme baturini TaxID=241478 RepID=A0A183IJ41_9BILA|nr:unnamed protein product [Soboliphyme baturini]
MAHLCSLPNDVYQLILPRLSFCDVLRLEATCRFCQKVCQLYWRTLVSLDMIPLLNANSSDVLHHGYKFDRVAKNLILRASPYLKRLSLSSFGPLDYSLQTGLENAVLDYCGRLQAIELNNRILDKDWLVELAKRNPGLRQVSLCNVYVRNRAGLDDELLATLLHFLSQLQVLVLRDNQYLRMSCYAALPPSLLKVLAMTYVRGMTYIASPLMRNIHTLTVNTIAQMCQTDFFIKPFDVFANLRSLSVSSHMMTDSMFAVIGQCFLKLQELYIFGNRASFVRSVTCSFLQLKQLPFLRKIGTQENPMGRTLLLLCYHFPKLQELDLSYAIKERDLDDVWCDIHSNVLEVLIMKGFTPASVDSSSCQRTVLEKLRPLCPLLRKVIL